MTLRNNRDNRRKRVPPELPSEDEDQVEEYRSVPIKNWVWRRLEEIGREAKPKRTRPFVLNYFLEWAIKDYDASPARKKK